MTEMERAMARSLHQSRVDDFMRRAGQDVPASPVVPSDEVRILRAKLMLEETLETIRGMGVAVQLGAGEILLFQDLTDPKTGPSRCFKIVRPVDLEEVADGCWDTCVVTTGTLSAFGIADEMGQQLVDEANLAKFGPGGHRREDGKWIKPPDWKKPDIPGLLKKQAGEG